MEPDGPDVVMPDLAPLFPPLRRALEFGARKGHSYFEREALPHDPYHFAHTARLHASHALRGQRAPSATGDGIIKLERLPFSGISLFYAGYWIKVWKSEEGLLPVPGPSEIRKKFVNQQLSFLDKLLREEATQDHRSTGKPNLVLLWEETREGRVALTVVCPRAGLGTRDSVEEYWRCVVADGPAEDLGVADGGASPAGLDSGAGAAEVDDLPLFLDDHDRPEASGEQDA